MLYRKKCVSSCVSDHVEEENKSTVQYKLSGVLQCEMQPGFKGWMCRLWAIDMCRIIYMLASCVNILNQAQKSSLPVSMLSGTSRLLIQSAACCRHWMQRTCWLMQPHLCLPCCTMENGRNIMENDRKIIKRIFQTKAKKEFDLGDARNLLEGQRMCYLQCRVLS